MGKFGVDFSNFTTPTTTADTALNMATVGGEEAEIIEAIMTGSGVATAADRQHRAEMTFSDSVGAGTAGSAPTAELFNQRSAVATVTSSIEFTAEPTNMNTVSMVTFGFNQRGGMRWAVPRGEGIICSGDETEDTVNLTVVSDAAGAVDGGWNWWEA